VLKSGLTLWVSKRECDDLNAALLNGDRFIKIPRLQQTINIDMVAMLGVNDLFTDPKVAGAEFKFTPTSVVVKIGDAEAIYQGKGWKPTRDQFDKAMTFDDLLASQAIPQKEIDALQATKIQNNVIQVDKP
jgi:hypothetical protein